MVLGTGSGVGKSFIAAGLCRVLRNADIRVAPFKAQNMSNNSYVTREGGEMGRAQAVQAECAKIEPNVHMNPVLLKPAADNSSQVVVQGEVIGTMPAIEYYGLRTEIFDAIQDSYRRLSEAYEVIVIEGAGSPAEINLKALDMVNFRVAEMADAQCLLVGDIDRGGVFAWLLGTMALLDDSERDRITGLIINKFRGDLGLLEPGLAMLENLCGKKVLGVLPYEMDLWIEEEDAVVLEEGGAQPASLDCLDIAVILLPRISNATDFQILAKESGVSVRMVRRLAEFGDPDLVILPGTKATSADLNYLKRCGLGKRIQDYARSGGRVLGICGGFQMLGEVIEDGEGVESERKYEFGLGLLPVHTRFFPEKVLRQVEGRVRSEIFSWPVESNFQGYEIHMGQTVVSEGCRSLFEVSDSRRGTWRPEGIIDSSGRILGTYLHGLFDEAAFRVGFLRALSKSVGKPEPSSSASISSIESVKEKNYNRLGELLQKHINLNFLEPWLKLSSPLR